MKRDQELKDKLKKKILAEAQRVKEQKEKENSRGEREPETPPTIKSRRQAGESLPKYFSNHSGCQEWRRI